MSWFIYTLILIGLCWISLSLSRSGIIGKKTYLFSFLIKIGYGVFYLLLFTYYFSNGSIYGDTYRFLSDSEVIANITSLDLNVFFKLMLGYGELTPNEVDTYLGATQIWDYGNNGDWINDNRLILRLNVLIHFVSLHNPYIHALFFSFISFLGIHFIFMAFESFIKNKVLFWWALVLWPSLGFWGGSILKETILIFGIGLFFYSLFSFLKSGFKLKYIVYLTISILVLLFNKPYAGIFIIALSSVYVYGRLINWKLRGLILSSTLIGLLFITAVFLPGQNSLTAKISIKQKDLNNLGQGGIAFITDSSFCVFPYQNRHHFKQVDSQNIVVNIPTDGQYKPFGETTFYPFKIPSGKTEYPIYLIYPPSTSYFKTTPINYNPFLILGNIPQALINVLIRPFPWDNGDPLKIVSFTLNIGLIFALFFAFRHRSKQSRQSKYLIYTLALIAFFTAVIIGLTIPIFGAIVRYKLPVEICLILITFILLKPKYAQSKTH